jgi:hypothetical protein
MKPDSEANGVRSSWLAFATKSARKLVNALLVAALGVVAVFWSQFVWVRATNFYGTDEWVFQWVAARRILSSPYSNRPFNFLWTIPGAHLGARGFNGFYAVHSLYLLGTALVTLALGHRLLPDRPRLGLLIAVLAAVWAPSDPSRLATVQMTVNSGFTFGAIVAVWLYVVSWQGRSRVLLALAAAWALLMVRGYEAVAPAIFAAPRFSRTDPSAGVRVPSGKIIKLLPLSSDAMHFSTSSGPESLRM